MRPLGVAGLVVGASFGQSAQAVEHPAPPLGPSLRLSSYLGESLRGQVPAQATAPAAPKPSPKQGSAAFGAVALPADDARSLLLFLASLTREPVVLVE